MKNSKTGKQRDNFFPLVFKIPKLFLNTQFDKNCDQRNIKKKNSSVKSAYINLSCKHFLKEFPESFRICTEKSKNFTGRNSGMVSYLKTVWAS